MLPPCFRVDCYVVALLADDDGVDEVDAQPAVIVFTPGADPRHATDDVTEFTDTHGVKTQTGACRATVVRRIGS